MGSSELKYNESGKLYLRKSMVGSFGFCPHQFKHVWLDQNPITPTYKMIVGTRFHEFAYWFFDNCQGVDIDLWELLVPSAFTDFEQDMAAWFIDQERNRYYKFGEENFMPIQREVKLEWDKLALTGTCDRLDWVNKSENISAVVEYKTGDSFDEKRIISEGVFYKIIWENNIGLGNIRYMRYINPRKRIYKLIPLPQNIDDSVYINIAAVRGAIRENKFPRHCTAVKHIVCNLCSAEECGAYDF